LDLLHLAVGLRQDIRAPSARPWWCTRFRCAPSWRSGRLPTVYSRQVQL